MKLALYIQQTNYTIESASYGFLFTRCKTLETHSFTTLTRSFLKFCNSLIKIRTAHLL